MEFRSYLKVLRQDLLCGRLSAPLPEMNDSPHAGPIRNCFDIKELKPLFVLPAFAADQVLAPADRPPPQRSAHLRNLLVKPGNLWHVPAPVLSFKLTIEALALVRGYNIHRWTR